MSEISSIINSLSNDELYSLYAEIFEYESQPPDIETFLSDPYYLGNFYGDNGCNPYWNKFLRQIFSSPFYSQYYLISLKGAIGRGKTFTACAGFAYEICLLSHMKNPQKNLGLPNNTKIVFAIFNRTIANAQDVAFDTLNNMFMTSPYFTNLLGRLNKVHDLPHNISLQIGSRVGHSLGRAVFCLSGNTKIPLFDGKEVTIKEIVENIFPNEKKIYTHSYDLKRKCLVPGRIKDAKKTGINKEVYRVHLSNGEDVDATLEHKFILRDGKKKHLKYLKVGDRLFPMKFSVSPNGDLLYQDSCNHHEIVKIEYLGRQDVYNLSIEEYENFALSSGILISNSALLDEANFDLINNQLLQTFQSILMRMETRFSKQESKILPGKLWVVSSETGKSSNLNKIVESYRNKYGVLINEGPTWEVFPERYDMSKTFKLFKGSDFRKPEIITTYNRDLLHETDFIIDVPEKLKAYFETDIYAALRDLAGVHTGSAYRLFALTDKLNLSFKHKNIFPDIVRLDFFNDHEQIIEFLIKKDFFRNLEDRTFPRNIHIDIGLTQDRLGFASSYCFGTKKIEYTDPVSLRTSFVKRPLIKTEFCLAVEAKSGQQIPLFKIRLFIKYLRSIKYPLGIITLDSFQSDDFIQILKKDGLSVGKLSLDRSIEPYHSGRELLYNDFIHLPHSELLKKEMEELELINDGTKVDHPITGSKDVADAVFGSIWNTYMNYDKLPLFSAESLSSESKEDRFKTQLFDLFWGKKNNSSSLSSSNDFFHF